MFPLRANKILNWKFTWFPWATDDGQHNGIQKGTFLDRYSFRFEMALNGVYSANGNGASTRPEGGAGGATALTKAKTRNSD